MMTVAVVTRGHFGSDGGLAERHRLAVIRVAIVFEPVFVALATAGVTRHLEVPVLRCLNFMGGVAIRANGPPLIALDEQLAVDALFVNLFDTHMALATGSGDVGVVDRRFPVHAAFDVVDPVTIVARRRDDEPHLEQCAPVNAVEVLRGGLGILHLILLREAGVAMALGTGLREIQLEDRRVSLLDWRHVVGAMTIPAVRRPGGAHSVAQTMNTGRILL